MTEQEARQWVTSLAAHYRRHEFTQPQYDAYTAVVARYPYEGAGAVLARLALAHPYMPAVSEIGTAFATAAVGAPLPAAAWEQASLLAAYVPQMRECGACKDYPGQELVPGTEDEYRPCSVCQGTGVRDVGAKPVLHPVVRRTLDSVGGSWAVKVCEQPLVLRGAFIRAYTEFLQAAYAQAALGRPWQAALEEAPQPRALAAGGG